MKIIEYIPYKNAHKLPYTPPCHRFATWLSATLQDRDKEIKATVTKFYGMQKNLFPCANDHHKGNN